MHYAVPTAKFQGLCLQTVVGNHRNEALLIILSSLMITEKAQRALRTNIYAWLEYE